MNCSHFKHSILAPIRENLRLFTATVAFLLLASVQSIALEATSSLSGRVLDLKGDPVSGFRLMLAPIPPDSVEDINDPWFQENMTFMDSRTDEMGRFSIRNIAPVKVRLEPFYGV